MKFLNNLLNSVGAKDLDTTDRPLIGELVRTFEIERAFFDTITKSNCLAVELSPGVMDNQPELIVRGINTSENGLNYQIKKYTLSDGKRIDAQNQREAVGNFQRKYNASQEADFTNSFILWSKTIQDLPDTVDKIKFSLYLYPSKNLFYLIFEGAIVLMNRSSDEEAPMAGGLPCPPFC